MPTSPPRPSVPMALVVLVLGALVGGLVPAASAGGPSPSWAVAEGTRLTFTESVHDADGNQVGEGMQVDWTVAAVEQGAVYWQVASSGDNVDDGTWIVDAGNGEILEAPNPDLVGSEIHLYLAGAAVGERVDLRGLPHDVEAPDAEGLVATVYQGDGFQSVMLFNAEDGLLRAWVFDTGDASLRTVLTNVEGGSGLALGGSLPFYILVFVEFLVFLGLYMLFLRRAKVPPPAPAAFCTRCGNGLAVAGSTCPVCARSNLGVAV